MQRRRHQHSWWLLHLVIRLPNVAVTHTGRGGGGGCCGCDTVRRIIYLLPLKRPVFSRSLCLGMLQDVMARMEEQVHQFVAYDDTERQPEHFRHFLDHMVPCLTEFFVSCEDPNIGFSLEDSGTRIARRIATGLLRIANMEPLRPAQVPCIQAFQDVMVRIVGDVGALQLRVTPPPSDDGTAPAQRSVWGVLRDPAGLQDGVRSAVRLRLALWEVQQESHRAHPPGAIDDMEGFGRSLLKESGSDLDPDLLKKLMTQIMEGALNTTVKVGLMRCFTAVIDRQKAISEAARGANGLRDVQVVCASEGKGAAARAAAHSTGPQYRPWRHARQRQHTT